MNAASNTTKVPATGAQKVVSIFCALSLFVSLFAAGFAACSLPLTTSLLSQYTSNFAGSPYAPSSLVSLAEETRAYTLEDYGRSAGEKEAENTLALHILNAALRSSSEASPTAERWDEQTRAVLDVALEAPSAAGGIEMLAAYDDAYALDRNALSHLDDCYSLVSRAIPLLWGVFIVFLGTFAYLFAKQRRIAARILILSPSLLLALLLLFGAWALLDFNGLFTAFHHVFFPQGNWTFSYSSLLISMYPLGFWMGMGAVWLVISLAMSILSLFVGFRLRKR